MGLCLIVFFLNSDKVAFLVGEVYHDAEDAIITAKCVDFDVLRGLESLRASSICGEVYHRKPCFNINRISICVICRVSIIADAEIGNVGIA